MPADKLGQYIRSDLFLKRVNEAIAEAVRALEANGIKPVYISRQQRGSSHTNKSAGKEQQ